VTIGPLYPLGVSSLCASVPTQVSRLSVQHGLAGPLDSSGPVALLSLHLGAVAIGIAEVPVRDVLASAVCESLRVSLKRGGRAARNG
jgi:hypothetical protein